MSAQTAEQAVGTLDSTVRQLPPSMVERMSLILDAFETPTARLTLEEVARNTHLPRSTAHRILDQLVRVGWLTHTAQGYSLGKRALGLGGGGRVDSSLRAAAAPVIHELQLRTGLVAHLASLDGGDVCYLDKLGGRFAATVPSRVGGRAPAHSTALGKAMLAWIEPEEVDRRLAGGLDRFTGRTIGDLESLHQELNRVRSRNGTAIERGESFPDIACAAAAVRGPEGPLGAISLVGDLSVDVDRVAPLVLAAARAVAGELFGGVGPRPVGRRGGSRTTTAWTARTMGELVAPRP